MRHLPLILAALLLLGADECEQTPPEPNPQNGNAFCYGNDYTIAGTLRSAVHDVSAGLEAILMGKPSTDRRATVRVRFGSAYCSGVALGPRIVLTAGHCGYGASAEHTVHLGGYGEKAYQVAKHIVHPDYLKYVANPYDLEARKADLMVLHMAEDVPGPYPEGIYHYQALAKECLGGVAQGWGRHEGEGLELRETQYVITDWDDPKYLVSRARELGEGQESGRICFGDSGGPLYMDVNGLTYLAGITTTTMSSDCLTGGTHVSVPAFMPWIEDAIRSAP